MPNKHTKERIIKLLDNRDGFTTTKIAEIVDCHYTTAAKLLNELFHNGIVDEEYYDFNNRIWKIVED